MSDPIQFIWTLVQFQPAALTMAAVVVIGYLLKCIPQVLNQRIPIYIVVVATALYYGMVTPRPAKMPDIIATIILGSVVGLLAWLFHNQILKRFIDSHISFPEQPTKPQP
jgi:hypothetical protein